MILLNIPGNYLGSFKHDDAYHQIEISTVSVVKNNDLF